MENIVDSFVEVELPSGKTSANLAAGDIVSYGDIAKADFLKVKETLTRIGIASRKDNKLYQSVHILHKQGKYYLVHFKEMFLLDGREADFTEEDKVRRNLIAARLQEWGLVKIKNPNQVDNGDKTAYIKIIPFSEKNDWELIQKYSVGKHKRK